MLDELRKKLCIINAVCVTVAFLAVLLCLYFAADRATALIAVAVVLLVSLVIALLLINKVMLPAERTDEVKHRFITDLNHELKTPLAIAAADLDLLEMEKGESVWLDNVRSEHANLAALVGKVTELTRLDEGGVEVKKELLDVSELAGSFADEFSAVAFERGFHLVENIEEGCMVEADLSLLRRVLFILMDNAIKYCDEGGEICIAVRRPYRRVVVEVSNTYLKCGEFDADHVFDRFYRSQQARDNSTGHGIGLSIAKAAMKRHGGSVYARVDRKSNTVTFAVML